jgi:hypothetical protein
MQTDIAPANAKIEAQDIGQLAKMKPILKWAGQ